MSKPSVNHDNPVMGAFIEITGASSALHMDAKPIKDAKADTNFLCDRDEWAKHAVEHLCAAANNVVAIQDSLREVHSLLFAGVSERTPEYIKALEIIEKLI